MDVCVCVCMSVYVCVCVFLSHASIFFRLYAVSEM